MTTETGKDPSLVHISYKPYPAYKDSGIEWLGKIPVHWGMTFLDKVVDSSRRITYGIVQPGTPDPNGIFMVRGQNYSNGWSDPDTYFRVSPEIEAPYKRSRLIGGDVLMTIVGAGTGNIAIVPDWLEGANLTQTTARIAIASSKANNRFMAFLLQSRVGRANVKLTVKGAAQPGLNLSHVAKYRIVLPPVDEQPAIANFLDRKTAEIDELIAKKERLIELLQEKRAALITQAVTKGLDPTVPIKESGVEWLGKIPAHWAVKRIKHLVELVTSGSRGWAEFYSAEGPLFLRIGNLRANSLQLNLSDIQHVNPPHGSEGERTRVRPGDLLLSITANIGSIGVVPQSVDEAFVNQHIALVRLKRSGAIPGWLGYCLISSVGQEQFNMTLYGGTKAGLGLEDVRSLVVLMPPTDEQLRLEEFLDSEERKDSILIDRIHKGIENLREYRKALISAAVTGKIDVRAHSFPPQTGEG